MEPIINPAIFWIASICGMFSTISMIVCSVVLIMLVFLLLFLFLVGSSDSTKKNIKKGIKLGIIAFAISLPIMIFCPKEDTVYLMAASSLVTTDNVEAFKESIEKRITFTVETINSLNPVGDNKNVD